MLLRDEIDAVGWVAQMSDIYDILFFDPDTVYLRKNSKLTLHPDKS